jgi:hypothetical protein
VVWSVRCRNQMPRGREPDLRLWRPWFLCVSVWDMVLSGGQAGETNRGPDIMSPIDSAKGEQAGKES